MTQMIFLLFFYFYLFWLFCAVERKGLRNIGRGQYKKHSYEIWGKFAQRLQRSSCLKEIIDAEWQTTNDNRHQAVAIAHNDHYVFRWASDEAKEIEGCQNPICNCPIIFIFRSFIILRKPYNPLSVSVVQRILAASHCLWKYLSLHFTIWHPNTFVLMKTPACQIFYIYIYN